MSKNPRRKEEEMMYTDLSTPKESHLTCVALSKEHQKKKKGRNGQVGLDEFP